MIDLDKLKRLIDANATNQELADALGMSVNKAAILRVFMTKKAVGKVAR